jgi:NTP pyrophosphatase (non-canonical NTP hydrolase)
MKAIVKESQKLDFDRAQVMAHQNSVDHGFWEHCSPKAIRQRVPEKLVLIHSELSEALEALREGQELDKVYLVDGKPDGFGAELADAVIRIMDLAEALGISLGDVIQMKMRYNAGRPFRHGKQF